MSGRTRTFFVSDELWARMGEAAGRAGVSRSGWLAGVVRDALDPPPPLPTAGDRLAVPREPVWHERVDVRRPVRPFSKGDQARGKR